MDWFGSLISVLEHYRFYLYLFIYKLFSHFAAFFMYEKH